MPVKISFNKTNDTIAQEEARKMREIENEIQLADKERDRKILKLRQKRKIMSISIISVVSVILVACIIFGIVGVFFRHSISEEKVREIAYPYSIEFPKEGVEGYLRRHINELFQNYLITDAAFNAEYSDVIVDKNSLNVFRIEEMNYLDIRVWFTLDITTVEKDHVVDADTLKQLQKTGFGIPQATPTPTPAPTPTPTPVPPPPETSADAVTTSNGDETAPSADAKTDTKAPTKKPTKTPTAAAAKKVDETTDTSATENTDVNEPTETTTNNDSVGSVEILDTGTGELNEYYMTPDGIIMQKGKKITQTYAFQIPLHYFSVKDGDFLIQTGYEPVGDLILYSLVDADEATISKINPNYAWEFTSPECDEQTVQAAKIKVSKTLEDLYAGRDTSQDFFNYKPFNTYDAKFGSVNYFKMYQSPNAMGYNAYVEYTITLPQGFTYSMHMYLLVEESGNSWIITDIS